MVSQSMATEQATLSVGVEATGWELMLMRARTASSGCSYPFGRRRLRERCVLAVSKGCRMGHLGEDSVGTVRSVSPWRGPSAEQSVQSLVAMEAEGGQIPPVRQYQQTRRRAADCESDSLDSAESRIVGRK